MSTYKSYHSYLINSLKDPAEAAAYLDAVFEDGDKEHILLALKNVAEARKSAIEFNKQTDSDWENLVKPVGCVRNAPYLIKINPERFINYPSSVTLEKHLQFLNYRPLKPHRLIHYFLIINQKYALFAEYLLQ